MTQKDLSPAEAMRLLFSNRRLTLETLLQIEDKGRQLLPFRCNFIQADMIQNSGNRDIYVKPGQVGATSVWTGDFLIDNITINGTVSTIISYDEFSAQRLLQKAKKFHQSCQRIIPTIPRLDHKSASELSFVDKDTGFYSVFYIFSARSYTIGRGEAIHNLLLDEFAFWPDGSHEEVFGSAVQRVPLLPNTKIRVLSTANGEDNPHCEMYRAAKEGKRYGVAGSVYKWHFYPWFVHEEYEMKEDDPFCLEDDQTTPLTHLTDTELGLLKMMDLAFHISPEVAMRKLRWRRYKQAEMRSLKRSGKTVFIFEQEYPEDDESCFITAGNQAYSAEVIEQKVRTCYPAPTTKACLNKKTGVSAEAQLWHIPNPSWSYVIGIDPGKGKQSESVAHVWHFEEGYQDNKGIDHPAVFKHCATLAGWYDEWEMAEYCKDLGYFYNTAVLAPEDNLDIVSHMRDYPSLYYREDVRTGKLIRAVGWQTSTSTKPYMLTELNRHMEDLECQDVRFWSQCKNIRRDPTMKYGIKVVGSDDHHDAGAIAVCCRSAQAVPIGYAGSSGESGGWGENWGR